jgi:hypothetical protein
VACAFLAYQVLGVLGGGIGLVGGFVLGAALFVRVILERLTRRLIPEVWAFDTTAASGDDSHTPPS